MIAVAFDIGGTFTDFVLQDGTRGRTHSLKVPTTPDDPSIAVVDGLARILAQAGTAASDVRTLLHATTVATNAVLERKGAPTGLITTAGFRDVLIIGRQKRYETYDLYISKPAPLIKRRHIVEVEERTGAAGEVVKDLDIETVDAAIDAMRASGREAVAISLLHAYANPEHEQRIRNRFAERAPELLVSISSEVSPRLREYERTNTTVANAYIRPIVARYLGHLEAAFRTQDFSREFLIMQSNGGLVSPSIARDFPVRIIESGPAAGIIMCAEIGRSEGHREIITFDMGGTTAKLGAIDNGTPAVMPTLEVDLVRHKRGSGLAINVPAIEMLEIGAGGGSIARLDRGMITVGPESAGADPGPACYGRGGTSPTITDANVVLGYISPAGFNAGELNLDAEAAHRAIAEHIADPAGLSVVDAAWGVHLIATSNMENALRLVSIERGRDPRNYAMVAFGGAGPIHAARLARNVGVPAVIIPQGAGVGSAIGLLQAEPRLDVSATNLLRLNDDDAAQRIADLFRTLEERARHEIDRVSPGQKVSWARYAQMRYVGQGFEIHVDLPEGSIRTDYPAQAEAAFNAAYMQRNKFVDDEGVVEVVDWTLVAKLPRPPTGDVRPATQHHQQQPVEAMRKCWFPEADGFIETPILTRQALVGGQQISGPAIIEDPDCTIVVPPGDRIGMSANGNLVIDIKKGDSHGL
ncbi:MAG: hydantoinase/oxoprolinase family protein [Hyphomicrobiaceae bacterium]